LSPWSPPRLKVRGQSVYKSRGTSILFIYGWNQYLWPFLITTDQDLYTIVMGIQRMVNVGEGLPIWHLTMGTAILAMVPPVLVVLAMQRLFVKGLVESEK